MEKMPLTLYRAEQVRELDRIAIEEFGIAGIDLMSRAGEVIFQVIRQHCPEAVKIAVFSGSGNNAGDGYIAARLALSSGFRVVVFSVADPEHLSGDSMTAYRTFVEAGGSVLPYRTGLAIEADVIIDALLGTGLDRPVTGAYAEAIDTINAHPAKVISADIPSGLNADTGHIMGRSIKADFTATFIGLKQGLFTGKAADYTGEIIYSSLSVPNAIFQHVVSSTARAQLKPLPPRNRSAHKGQMGHILVVGGDQGYSGAARMAGEAALRTGAGLVSIATRAGHASILNLTRPELMCHGVESVEQLQPLLAKADVIVLGPGIGQSLWSKSTFDGVITSRKPLVIDADGLNLLAATNLTGENWILTPHPGEAARLLNSCTADVQQDRFQAVSAIQSKYRGVVVLKGSGTLIAGEKTLTVSNSGNPGMATGGMGDVLAGVIGALIGQGLPLRDAAEQGVYLHGLAADLAAERNGERGLLPTDLMPYLRQLMN